MEEYWWAFAVLLLALGMGLGVLEIFVPSGGLLSFLAFSSVVGAIICGFLQGEMVGLGVLLAAVVGGPVLVVLALKYWPKTAVGRRVLLMTPESEDVLPEDSRAAYLKTLIGQVGRARCKMLPAGAIIIDGRTVDAVSEGVAIKEGELVRVIEFRANRVVVRPVEEETPSETAEDPLRRPIDSITGDPFDEEPKEGA